MINKYILSGINESDFDGLYKAIDSVFKNNNVTKIEIVSANAIVLSSDLIKLVIGVDMGVFMGSNSYKTNFSRCLFWEEKKFVIDKIIAYLMRTGLSGGIPPEVVKSETYLYMMENLIVTYTEEDVWDDYDEYLFEDVDLKNPIAYYDMRNFDLKIVNEKVWKIYCMKNDCINRGKNVFLKYNPNYDEVILLLNKKLGRKID